MPIRVYGSNMFMIFVFIALVLTIFSVFNIFVFGYLLTPKQFIIFSVIFSSIIIYVSLVKKVYLYENELVFRKVLSQEAVSYEDIHRIMLNEKIALSEEQKMSYNKHSESIDYFVLLDKNEEIIMEIYTGLIGNYKKQNEFIDLLVSKNNKIRLD